METEPTKFVGRISLSAESKRIQFTFGRYDTGPTKFVDPTEFVGRISLSAESIRIQFIFGRYGYLPYIGGYGMETGPTEFVDPTKFVGRMSLSAECQARVYRASMPHSAITSYTGNAQAQIILSAANSHHSSCEPGYTH